MAGTRAVPVFAASNTASACVMVRIFSAELVHFSRHVALGRTLLFPAVKESLNSRLGAEMPS